MALVEFQSEIARLVYGYLVKENLTALALKFLTGSQYLENCLRINATGVSLESKTKLIDKDLDELLIEYVAIHDLVNNKINLLPKTSDVYIEININCKNNLLKAIEVLLNSFINNKEDEIVQNEKSSNNSTESSGEFCDKNYADGNYISDNNSNGNNDAEEESCHYEEPPPPDESNGNSENHNEPGDSRTLNTENCEFSENQSEKNDNDNIPKNLEDCTSVIYNDNQCLTEEAMEVDSVPQYVEENQSEGNIKILRIETQNQGDIQTLNLYPDSINGNEGGINENSPVVFVDSSVGDFRINQDPNQIIVIPIDSYEAAFEEAVGNQENQKEGINENLSCKQQRDLSYQVIPDIPPDLSTSLCNNRVIKNSVIDSNIITESDFLKTKEIIYDPCSASASTAIIPQETPTTSGTVQQQIVIVPQTRERFRKILPKAKKVKKNYSPAVVFVPVINKDPEVPKPEENPQPQSNSQPPSQPEPQEKSQTKVTRQLRQKSSNAKRKGGKASNKKISETDTTKNLNMPNISTMLLDESPAKNGENTIVILDTNDKIEEDKNKNNEEKEKPEEKEPAKIETPLVLSTRNSKRLSLSTPRRRSHIRALEFETPPKTNDEKKKSQTSPKVKVDQVTVERKNVRNTLFKSPDPETIFKSPMCLKSGKKVSPKTNEVVEPVEPLNEMTIPIATRSPKVATLSETWEKLTGVTCVLERLENVEDDGNSKKSWDSDLRCFIALNKEEVENNEKKRVRKPEKVQKDNKRPGKKKLGGKKSKTPPAMASSSKMSLTAKRNTYSISENVEKSPVRGLQDELNLVTPFKDPEPIRPMEETPMTKLIRENIGDGFDIDLSTIPTPSFPPTPSILITPDCDDLGANYYTPLKDEAKKKLMPNPVIIDRLQTDKTKKQETKEIHEKVMGELVTKAQEIIGLRPAEENSVKKPPSGKILSMVKVQMITQCDKKLCKNIPINESVSFSDVTQETVIENVEEKRLTPDIQVELDEKKKRTMKKIKGVKENLSAKSNKVTRNLRKRKRSSGDAGGKKSKLNVSSDISGEKLTESDESIKKDAIMVHSTPYPDKIRPKLETPGKKKLDREQAAEEIKKGLPDFKDDNSDRYPELDYDSRKKIHFIENLLNLDEIVKYFNCHTEKSPGKLDLKSSIKILFQVLHKWLKKVDEDSQKLNPSHKTKETLSNYLAQFNTICKGLKNKKCKKDSSSDGTNSRKSNLHAIFKSYGEIRSEDEDADWKRKENVVRKDEEVEDGVVSTLPLKKRKANVQSMEKKENRSQETPEDLSTTANENVSQTQTFLQDIDVDRFLSQIHGQNNR